MNDSASDLRLAAHSSGRSTSPERLRWQLAVANVNALLASQAQTKPPVDLRRLSKALGVTRISFGPLVHDAALQPEKGGFRIILKDGVARTRSRFSWAHELAHLLLDRPRDGAAAYRTASQREIESDCDSLAAEILMPREMFTRELAPLGHGLTAVPILARTFQTSVTATAIRMVKTQPVNCTLTAWNLKGVRTARLAPTWTVRGGTPGQPRRTFPPDGSGRALPRAVALAFESSQVVRTREAALLEVPGSGGVLRMVELPTESWSYGTGTRRTVLSLSYLRDS